MPPRVITIADLQHTKGELRLPIGSIVTPAARDHAEARGIKFIFTHEHRAPEAQASTPLNPPVALASRIDHTLLHPAAVEADILALCAEAQEHAFASVCVNPTWVTAASRALQGGAVHVCAVVGFPTGAHATSLKAVEAGHCVDAGAQEIDMVANSGWLKDGRVADYTADIAAVRQRISAGTILKVIIEAPLLTPEQIVRAATVAAHAGCDYVKTSTGVYAQARIEDVQLIRRAVPERVKVKAAGGIRTAAQAVAMIEAGADRIGSSNSVAIVWESKK